MAVAPAAAGSIPLQLVRAEAVAGAATASGAMTGASYIQRLNTKGGVAATIACEATGQGKRRVVADEAGYVFYGMRSVCWRRQR